MTDPANDRRIDYLELPAPDLPAAKAFYGAAFGWEFVDYGDAYASFHDGRLEGGLNPAREVFAGPLGTGPLVVLFARDLEAAEAAVAAAGGEVVVPIFAFPGGRRFHFTDPAGNELAVWTDVAGETEA